MSGPFDFISIVFVRTSVFSASISEQRFCRCRIPNFEYDRFYTAIKKIQKHDSTTGS